MRQHLEDYNPTRTEYNNTVRDLLGDTEAPGNAFPADDYSHGFDNIAEVLTLSPLLVEKYELAAQSLIDNALTLESTVPWTPSKKLKTLSVQ